jgi:hypothetical protein
MFDVATRFEEIIQDSENGYMRGPRRWRCGKIVSHMDLLKAEADSSGERCI